MPNVFDDPFEKMGARVYMDSPDEARKEFPYNMQKLREFLHATGKTLEMIMPNEMEMFRIPGR